jgi:hypothetical protein
MSWLKAVLGFAGSAYIKDAYMRPRQMGRLARNYCDRVQKPLLLIHDPGLLGPFFGPPVQAEYTLHRALPVRYPNKSFGAIFATGILEQEMHPAAVLGEWSRVADRTIVVVPSWWSPHAWLNPSNRWIIDPSLKTAAPLWDGRRHVYLLQVSDKAYAPRPWSQKSSQPNLPPTTHLSTMTSSSANPETQSRSSALPETTNPNLYLNLPSIQSPEDTDENQISTLSSVTNEPFESSNSVSHLTVLSAQDFDES